MDAGKYVTWINDWLKHVDFKIKYVGKSGSHEMFSFLDEPVLLTCPEPNEVICFDDNNIFLDVSDVGRVNAAMLIEMIELPDECFEVQCAIWTAGLILHS